jgi:branched-chain amino acid aminotransferase
MGECAGRFFVLNGQLTQSEKFDNKLVYEGESVYEIMRILKGVPLFFNDHMDRLIGSVSSSEKEFLSEISKIRTAIINLIEAEGKVNGNLKLVFNYKVDSANLLIYFVEASYPTEVQYQHGVRGILFPAQRKDPGSKVINQKLRAAISEKLSQTNAYEALLVNEDNEITEGSRSNIFFMKDEMFVTAPECFVLNGITRRNILKICDENRIRVEFRCVPVNELPDYDSVIMTGTSPLALPFSSVDDIVFETGFPLIRKLRELYLERADENIRLFNSDR